MKKNFVLVCIYNGVVSSVSTNMNTKDLTVLISDEDKNVEASEMDMFSFTGKELNPVDNPCQLFGPEDNDRQSDKDIKKHFLEELKEIGFDQEAKYEPVLKHTLSFSFSPILTTGTGIDWDLLKKQKLRLLELIWNNNAEYGVKSKPHTQAIEGIVSLIDSIQDFAVDVLGFDKNKVLALSEQEEYDKE